MVKVTIVFKNTNTVMIFRANDFVKTRDRIILGRRDPKNDLIMIEATTGMIYFDPREAIGFDFERI